VVVDGRLRVERKLGMKKRPAVAFLVPALVPVLGRSDEVFE